MNKRIIAGVIALLLIVAGGVLYQRITAHLDAISAERAHLETTIARLQDSLAQVCRTVDSLRAFMPGLGEYMSTIQLHMAKLWFASRSLNWPLATYELNELGETIEGAEALHAVKDSVNVSGVLQSVRQTQLLLLQQSIEEKDSKKFSSAYQQTLDACNGCHRSAGYHFVHIIVPTGEPVTNQQWSASTKGKSSSETTARRADR